MLKIYCEITQKTPLDKLFTSSCSKLKYFQSKCICVEGYWRRTC